MEARPAIHPSAAVLEAFALAKLDDTTASRVVNHLDGCPDCRKAVASLSDDDFLVRLRQAHDRSGTSAPAKSLSASLGSLSPIPADTSLVTIPNVPPELARHPQYVVLRELGRGGMGVVYLAKNKLMDRLEVLKVINKDLLNRPGAAERFQREIRSAARLSHANIVTAYSVLQQGDVLAFAMEYVPGEDLAGVVKAHGPLPVPYACYYVQQVAFGLQQAFEKGMVHRDIKPQNLILARDGARHIVKVLDFGLAKATREKGEDTALTGEGRMLGTPDYIAPEQTVDAARADIRADIYSLGCTLYFLLTGGPPFRGRSLYEILQAHHSVEAREVNVVRSEVPEGLSAVVRKMMAKELAQRYQQPIEVVQALGPFIRQSPPRGSPQLPTTITAATAGVMGQSAPVPEAPPVAWDTLTEGSSTSRESDKARTAPTHRRSAMTWRKGWLGIGIGVGVLLLTLLVLWAGGVFRVKTKEGILVVEVDEPNTEVYLDGSHVTVAWEKNGKRAELRVKPGTHRVEIKKDGITVKGEEVELRDGDRRILTARLVTGGKPPSSGLRPPLLDCTGKDGVSASEMHKAQAAWAKYLGGKVEETVEIADGVTMTFALVPPGKFRMGSRRTEQDYVTNKYYDGGRLSCLDDETLHEVTLTEPFYLGKYEVTQAQYEALTGDNPSHFKGADRPVEMVSWEQAQYFAAKLTKTRMSKQVYRLPTEAEWEYSCRGGRSSSKPFGIGDGLSLSSRQANFNGKTYYGDAEKGPYLKSTCKVGSYSANALGLYDMHGNVWEWCADWYGPYAKADATNPTGPTTGSIRVTRGGGWVYMALSCRAANRGGGGPGDRANFVGFRLARSSPFGVK